MWKSSSGREYVITDYRDRELPNTTVIPVRKEPSGYYLCKNNLGGNVRVKPGEFLRFADKTGLR